MNGILSVGGGYEGVDERKHRHPECEHPERTQGDAVELTKILASTRNNCQGVPSQKYVRAIQFIARLSKFQSRAIDTFRFGP